MKTAFNSNGEVCSVFLSQSQFEGRSNSIFFYGNKIYSYGYHYLLAEILTDKKGNKAILINDSGYSATTGKHISLISSLSRSYTQFFVSQTNVKKVLTSLIELSERAALSRTKRLDYVMLANTLFGNYLQYIYWTEGSVSEAIYDYMSLYFGQTSESERNLNFLKSLIIRDKREKRDAERQRANEQINRFFNFEIHSFSAISDVDYCRISQDGNFIETSRGQKFDILTAAKFYKQYTDTGKLIGQKIENYTVISKKEKYIQIGCHKIDTKNFLTIGNQLLKMLD